MGKQRIIWIDYAKAVAIFLVVLGHSFKPLGGADLEVKNFIYSFHMPVFFFLSGYLYKKSDIVFGGYLKKNVRSLVFPYVLLNLLAAIIVLPVLLLTNNYEIIVDSTTDMLIGAGHSFAGPAWFLLCLFWTKIISYFAFRSKCPFLFVIFSITAAYIIGHFVWFDIASAFAAFPFFYEGYIMKTKSRMDLISRKKWCVILSISLPLLFLLNHINGSVAIYSLTFGNLPWLYYIETTIGITFFISLMNLIATRENGIMNTLSRESIMIMALHGAVGLYISIIISKVLSLPNTSILYGLIISGIVVAILYYPSLRIQNKWPALTGGR